MILSKMSNYEISRERFDLDPKFQKNRILSIVENIKSNLKPFNNLFKKAGIKYMERYGILPIFE